MSGVVVSGSFDDLKSRHMRFLQEAAKLGPVHVLLWADEVVQALKGRPPKFPQAERQYFVNAIRYVDTLTLVGRLPSRNALPKELVVGPATWVVEPSDDNSAKRDFCASHSLAYRVIQESELQGALEVVEV